uniref:ubiquitinyl hydrolase 1 n=1 Tax=Meloidogyne incognita TaxID=6306 RepID=A0A914LRS2_MELIC
MTSTYCGKIDVNSYSAEIRYNAVYNLVIDEINKLSYQHMKVRHRPTPKLGQTGLSNRINSCFVNAILQCLFNTNKLCKLFESRAIERHINIKNQGTSKGALSASLSAYMNAYWSGQFSFLNTNRFLDIVSSFVQAEYDGNSQQDCHQFLIWFLIKLAADTNRGYEELSTNIEMYPNANLLKNSMDYITKQKRISSSIVADIFISVLCTISKCPTCGQNSSIFEQKVKFNKI